MTRVHRQAARRSGQERTFRGIQKKNRRYDEAGRGRQGNIEAADDRISHQIARTLEQEEKKRKTAEECTDQAKDDMHDEEKEKEESDGMPTKRAKAQDGERTMDISAEGDVGPDVRAQPEEDAAMEEEIVDEESMTLGQVIWKISKCDPMLNRWVEKTNDRNSRKDQKVWPAPEDGARAALSSSGATLLAQVDVTEVYSPPRVTAMAKKTGLNAGSAMDLRIGYDFTTQKDRERGQSSRYE